MYGYYNTSPSIHEYKDTYLKNCIEMMIELPIYEKLGISLTDLMEYDPADIKVIYDTLEPLKGVQNDIVNSIKKDLQSSKTK